MSRPKAKVPTYGLYGEDDARSPDFWIHAESIASRSQLYNWEIRQHRHESFFQILQVRNGTGDAALGERRERLSPGTIVTVPEKLTHGFRFSHDIDGQVITLMTSRLPARRPGTGWKSLMPQPSVTRLTAGSADGDYLTTTLDRIGDELAVGFGARSSLIEAYVEIVLTLLASREPGSDMTASRDKSRIDQLNDLIGAHFRQHHPVEFYAGEIGVSPTHLNRICRNETGRSMNELLKDRIMSQARRDLVFTFMTAQEIAWDLGFSDPAYFTRFFTREAGVTPRQFREQERRQLGEI
jgi:AraC family transcriptional regulator, transcriptional activator of pobA